MVLAALVAVLAGLPGTSQAATSAQIVSALNQQRASAGLPGDITENASWSEACGRHNEYEHAHDDRLSHGEPDTGSPTYSEAGDKISKGAVLAFGQTFDNGNPFVNAPIHLHQLLAPRLNVMGADERLGFTCVTTFGPPPGAPGYDRGASGQITLYTYPADQATGVVPTEIADEGPFTPGELLGIPEGTASGRYLHVFVDGPWATALPDVDITRASLAPAGGQPLELKVADRDVKTPDGRDLGDYLPEGGQLIPVKPLLPHTTYQARVDITVMGLPLSRSWSFTTGEDPPSGPQPTTIDPPPAKIVARLSIAKPVRSGGRWRFKVRANKVLQGHRATLTLRVPGRRDRAQSITLTSERTVTIKARTARLTVVVARFTTSGASVGPLTASRATGRR